MTTNRATVTQLYWLPHCSTCVKAQAFLLEKGVSIQSTHDLKASPLSKDVIAQLAEAVGGAEALFSKRAMKYRALGLHERTLTPAEMLDYMAEEYTFIKRPVIQFADGSVVAGFSAKALAAHLQNG